MDLTLFSIRYIIIRTGPGTCHKLSAEQENAVMSRIRKILSLLVNIYLFVSTVVICILAFSSPGRPGSQMYNFRGFRHFMFYTVDSNIFMSLCALLLIIYICLEKRRLARGKKVLPDFVRFLCLAASVSVGVTFITVACFLSPGQALAGRGYFSLFTGNNLFLHLLNPLAGCVDYIFFVPAAGAPGRRFSLKDCLIGMIPTAIYAVVYVVNVVFTRAWPDIYNFTFGGNYMLAPVVIIIMLALAFGIAALLTWLHNRVWKTS